MCRGGVWREFFLDFTRPLSRRIAGRRSRVCMENGKLESVKQLLSTLNCGAFLIDRGGRVVHVNSRLCALMQRTCDQLVGASVIDLYSDEKDRAVIRQSLEKFGEKAEEEFFLPLPDGGRLPIISSARPLKGAEDYRIVTIIDISRQKEAENAAKEQYQLVLEMSDTLLQQA